MLRESKDVKRIHDKKYPGLAVLHDNLTALFHNAKHRQRKDNNAPIIDTEQIENNVQAIASRYRQYDIGDAFATKLENAIPHLFTFVNYPGMDPTNNESERMLRKPVIFRGIRYGVGSLREAQMFSNILTCTMMWKKRGLNMHDMLLKALCGT